MIFEFCGGRGVRAGGQKMNHWIKKCPNFYFGMIRMMIARAFYQILVLYKWIFFALVSFSLKKMTWDEIYERREIDTYSFIWWIWTWIFFKKSHLFWFVLLLTISSWFKSADVFLKGECSSLSIYTKNGTLFLVNFFS